MQVSCRKRSDSGHSDKTKCVNFTHMRHYASIRSPISRRTISLVHRIALRSRPASDLENARDPGGSIHDTSLAAGATC